MHGSMIERVARTLFKMFRSVPPQGEAWRDYVVDAETILAAMREPTEEMVGDEIGRRSEIMDAMGAPIETQHRAMVREQLIAQWHTMIDAALEDGR